MASQRIVSSSPSSGDHYNSETAGASCWSPRTWHLDDHAGLRAEDAAPRSNAPRDSGRPRRVQPRQEARFADPALCQLSRNSAEEPAQASSTRLVRSALRQHVANLSASRSAFYALHFTSTSPASSPSKSRYRYTFFFGASDQLGGMPQGIRTGIESPRQEAKFAGPALCQLSRNSADEPTQVSSTRPIRSALHQQVANLPASRSAFY